MQVSHQLVGLSSEAAFAIDGRLRVTGWNRAAEAVLGYSEAEAVGRPCWQVLHATTDKGLTLCSASCSASACFRDRIPIRHRGVLGRHKSGHRVALGLTSLVAPQGEKGDGTMALIFLHPKAEPETSTPQPHLEVHCLGDFRVAVAQREVAPRSWKRQQSLLLLKYLLVHRDRPVHREELIEVLWPEVSLNTGLGRLKVVVYGLRQRLEMGGAEARHLRTEGELYRLDLDTAWLDAAWFERLADEGGALRRRGEPADAVEAYASARGLYRGPFLQGDPYAPWATSERERLREKYLMVLTASASLATQLGDLAGAASLYRAAIEEEPCREDLHRGLMEVLWQDGRREEALLQYRSCERVLHRELETGPLPETTELFEVILGRRPAPVRVPL